jgi:RIO kinase 2
MAFDPTVLPYLEDEEWRVLTATELGQRNHELVGTELIHSISGLRGGIKHWLDDLSRHRLIAHEGKPYDGYRLTKNGYDFLALHSLTKRGTITHLAGILGQGKEADVYSAFGENDTPLVVKFHRIGRVSFRKAKETREYLSKKHSSSWLYLSRLSAQREFNNLNALQGFPVPKAVDANRHCVVMSLVPGTLLNNIQEVGDVEAIWGKCMDIAVRLLRVGVVHADFTQFNLMIDEEENVTLIDFPQCMKHVNPQAEEAFDHDVGELARFFELRFGFVPESVPKFADFTEEIVPMDLFGRKKEDANEEEDGEEEDAGDKDAAVRTKVSKENRFKRKYTRRHESKTMSRLKLEAKNWD